MGYTNVDVHNPFGIIMSEWEPMNIGLEDDEQEPLPQPDEKSQTRESAAHTMHGEFVLQTEHLTEVRYRHHQVLVASGLLPESNLAEQHPELALKWFIDELNGNMITDGLELPMHGATLNDVELHTTLLNDGQHVGKLSIKNEEINIEKMFPIPDPNGLRSATFIEGKLRLRW